MKFAGLAMLRGRRVALAGTGVCAALTVLVYLGGIRPLMDRKEHVASHQDKLASLQKRDKQMSGQLATLNDKLSAAREAMARTPLKLQSALRANERLARMGDLACNNGVDLTETALGAPLSAPQYRMLPIHLAGKTHYRRCAEFLHKLHQEFSDMAIWSMELSRSAGDAPGQVTFQVRVIWFTAVEFGRNPDRIP